MQSFMQVGWERFLARLIGPAHFRFVLQPIVAILLGIRDGLQDAKDGRPPFLLALATGEGNRRAQIASLWHSMRIGLPVAIILDIVVQYMLFRSIRIVGAIIIGTLLMAVPYASARGLANRIARAGSRVKSRSTL